MENTPTRVYSDINNTISQSHLDSEQRLTLTIKQTASVLGISTSLAYTLAREGTLPGVLKLGQRYIVSKFLLNKYLNDGDGNGPD